MWVKGLEPPTFQAPDEHLSHEAIGSPVEMVEDGLLLFPAECLHYKKREKI